MILEDIGFIITDTPRSYIYLQILLKKKIYPNYILYLKNSNDKIIPEINKRNKYIYNTPKDFKKYFGSKISIQINLINEIKRLNINYDVYKSTNIHNKNIIKKILSRNEKTFIYSGYSGVILKKSILNTKKNFLHVHGGYLPKFKGSTTNYFSILEENTIGASAIFMNEKIDDGPILFRSKFNLPKKKIEIDFFYDSLIRAIVLFKTLKLYSREKKWPKASKTNSKFKNYYIIHPLLKHIAILK